MASTLWICCLFLAGLPLFSASEEAAVNTMLDDWHDAAAHAQEDRYFEHFSQNAVFLGTDASERWNVQEFRRLYHPYFSKGKAWSFRAKVRHITFSGTGDVGWFDEQLDTPNLGPARGSGVVVKQGGEWKIAQYNLTVPIPNPLMNSVKTQIEEFLNRPAKK